MPPPRRAAAAAATAASPSPSPSPTLLTPTTPVAPAMPHSHVTMATDKSWRSDPDEAVGAEVEVPLALSSHSTAPWTHEDVANAALLVLLYIIQGVPMGLAFGTVPMLLKGLAHLDYAEMGLFSLASYPYSLKLMWSPLVDALYWKSFGRRKSWIVPIQTMSGLLLFFVGSNIDIWLNSPGVSAAGLTIIFTVIIFLTATQDVAVDGWAISMLSAPHRGFAATCQTIGLNIGYFLSFTVFLSFNSAEFCNIYIRTPLGWSVQADGILQLGPFVQFWACLYLIVTLLIALFKREEPLPPDVPDPSVIDVYRQVRDVLRLPNMIELITVLVLCKLGFVCFDSVSALKLLDLGYKKENLALTVLLDFPLQLIIGYQAARYARGTNALNPWLWGYVARLIFALFGTGVVALYPTPGQEDVPMWYHILVLSSALLSSCTSTVMFVCLSAYFSVISDPAIGGTYMTLLNTFANLGGTWPQFFVMKAVDYATTAWCILPTGSSDETSQQRPPCVHHHEQEQCLKSGGTCETAVDGFYFVSILSFVVGMLMFVYIRRAVQGLTKLNPAAWRVRDGDGNSSSIQKDIEGNDHLSQEINQNQHRKKAL